MPLAPSQPSRPSQDLPSPLPGDASAAPGDSASSTASLPLDPVRKRGRMVESLRRMGIRDERVLAAMGSVPRHLFVDAALSARAYVDTSLPIGQGQTLSRPTTVARMTELLELGRGMRVLEIGTGSGYQSAVLAALGCEVHTIERIPELHRRSTERFRELGIEGVRTYLADGTCGLARLAPFDRILVTAGGPEVPEPLLGQLCEGGVMLIPVGGRQRSQRLVLLTRRGRSVYERDCGPAVFVDLVGDHGW